MAQLARAFRSTRAGKRPGYIFCSLLSCCNVLPSVLADQMAANRVAQIRSNTTLRYVYKKKKVPSLEFLVRLDLQNISQ